MNSTRASLFKRVLAILIAFSFLVQGPVAVAIECDGKVWFEIAKKRKGVVDVEEHLAKTESSLKKIEAKAAPKIAPPPKGHPDAKANASLARAPAGIRGQLVKIREQFNSLNVWTARKSVPSVDDSVAKVAQKTTEPLEAARATPKAEVPASADASSTLIDDAARRAGAEQRAVGGFLSDQERIASGKIQNVTELDQQFKALRALNQEAPRPSSAAWNDPEALKAFVEKAKAEQYRAEGIVKHLLTPAKSGQEVDLGKVRLTPSYKEAKQFQRFVEAAEGRLASMPQAQARGPSLPGSKYLGARAPDGYVYRVGGKDLKFPKTISPAFDEAIASGQKVRRSIGDPEGEAKFFDAMVSEGLMRKGRVQISRKDSIDGYILTENAIELARQGKLELEFMGDLMRAERSFETMKNLDAWKADLARNGVQPNTVIRTIIGNRDSAPLNFNHFMIEKAADYKASLKGAPDTPVTRVKYFFGPAGMGIGKTFDYITESFKPLLRARAERSGMKVTAQRIDQLAELSAARWFESAAGRPGGEFVELIRDPSSGLGWLVGNDAKKIAVTHSGLSPKNLGKNGTGKEAETIEKWMAALDETRNILGDHVVKGHLQTLFSKAPDANGVLRLEPSDYASLSSRNRALLGQAAKRDTTGKVAAFVNKLKNNEPAEIVYNRHYDAVLNMLTDSKYGSTFGTREDLARLPKHVRDEFAKDPSFAKLFKDIEEHGEAHLWINSASESSTVYGVVHVDNGPADLLSKGGYKGRMRASAPMAGQKAIELKEHGILASQQGHRPWPFPHVVRSKSGIDGFNLDTSYQAGKAPHIYRPDDGRFLATSYGEVVVDGQKRPVRVETRYDPRRANDSRPVGLIFDTETGPHNIVGYAYDEVTGKPYGYLAAGLLDGRHPSVMILSDADLPKARFATSTLEMEELVKNRNGAALNQYFRGGNFLDSEEAVERLIKAEIAKGKVPEILTGGSNFSPGRDGIDEFRKTITALYKDPSHHLNGNHPGYLKIYGGTKVGPERIEYEVYQEALKGLHGKEAQEVANKTVWIGRSNFEQAFADYAHPLDWNMKNDYLMIPSREAHLAKAETWDGTFGAMHRYFKKAVDEYYSPEVLARRGGVDVGLPPQATFVGGGGVIERGIPTFLKDIESANGKPLYRVKLVEGVAGSSNKLAKEAVPLMTANREYVSVVKLEPKSFIGKMPEVSGRASATKVSANADPSDALLEKVHRFMPDEGPHRVFEPGYAENIVARLARDNKGPTLVVADDFAMQKILSERLGRLKTGPPTAAKAPDSEAVARAARFLNTTPDAIEHTLAGLRKDPAALARMQRQVAVAAGSSESALKQEFARARLELVRGGDDRFVHIENYRRLDEEGKFKYENVVGVGGCNALDVAKVSAKSSAGLSVVPTLVSTACISVNKGVLQKQVPDGKGGLVWRKQAIKTEIPAAVYVPMQTLKDSSPALLNRYSGSGVADVMGRTSGYADYLYNRGTGYGPEMISRMREELRGVEGAMDWAQKDFKKWDDASLRRLTDYSHEASLSVIRDGSDRSVGSEHKFYNYFVEKWDHSIVPATHGEIVGAGSLISMQKVAEEAVKRGVPESEAFRYVNQMKASFQRLGVPYTADELAKQGLTKERMIESLSAVSELKVEGKPYKSVLGDVALDSKKNGDWSIIDRAFAPVPEQSARASSTQLGDNVSTAARQMGDREPSSAQFGSKVTGSQFGDNAANVSRQMGNNASARRQQLLQDAAREVTASKSGTAKGYTVWDEKSQRYIPVQMRKGMNGELAVLDQAGKPMGPSASRSITTELEARDLNRIKAIEGALGPSMKNQLVNEAGELTELGARVKNREGDVQMASGRVLSHRELSRAEDAGWAKVSGGARASSTTVESRTTRVGKRIDAHEGVAKRLQANQTEVFEKAFPFDTQFDVFATTKTADGAIFHVKPRGLADDVKALEGDLFHPQSTYYKDAPGFWDFMGFKERCHPSVGCYFATFPSAAEFEKRKKLWNDMAIRDGKPHRQIHMTYLEGDIAPMQRGMAKNMVEHNGATHIQNPTKVYMERYAPVGGGQHAEGVFDKIEIDPVTNKVKINGGLGRHDLFEMMNSPFIPEAVLRNYVEQAHAHIRMLEILNGKALRIEGEDINAFKKTFEGFVNAKDGKPAAQDPRSGINAVRFQEALLHHAMAAQHSDFHLGGWLLKHPEGINPANPPQFGWGNVFQKEIQMHLARIGAIAPGSKPPFSAPMVIENFKLAKETNEAVTLEKMLAHNFNTNNARFREGFERIRDAARKQSDHADPEISAEGRQILRELDEFKKADLADAEQARQGGKQVRSVFDERPFSETEVNKLAQEYRDKHKAISEFRSLAHSAQMEAIFSAPATPIRKLRVADIFGAESSRHALKTQYGSVEDIILRLSHLDERSGLSSLRRRQLAEAQAILDFPGSSFATLSPEMRNHLYRLAHTARWEALEDAGKGDARKVIQARAETVLRDFENATYSRQGSIRATGDEKLKEAVARAIREVDEKMPVGLFSPEASKLAKTREEIFVRAFKSVAGDNPEMEQLGRRLSHVCQAGANCGTVSKAVTAMVDKIFGSKVIGQADSAGGAKGLVMGPPVPENLVAKGAQQSSEAVANSIKAVDRRPSVQPVVRDSSYGSPAFGAKLNALDEAVKAGRPSDELLAQALQERPPFSKHMAQGEVQALDVPLFQDSLTEIWGVSYPRGKANGPLYHIRLRSDAEAVMRQNPEAFTKASGWTPLGTRINDRNRGLMEFLHVSKAEHPQAGSFYATRPSPTLFNALGEEFTSLSRGDAAIHLKGIVSGADTQTQMAEYFSKYGAIGFPDPARNTPYAPTGLGSNLAGKGSSLQKTIEVETLADGRKVVKGYDKGLEFHDGDEFLSALTISQRTHSTRKIDDAHIHEAWSAIRKEDGEGYRTARVFDLEGTDLQKTKAGITGQRKDLEGIRMQAFGGKADEAYRKEIRAWAQEIWDASQAAQKKARATMPSNLSPDEAAKYLRSSSWSAAGDRGIFVDKSGKVIGIAESRYVELEMYVLERRWHSGFHIHGYLADHPGGLSAFERVSKYGPMYEKENLLHMAGLGYRTVAVEPPPVSALIRKTVTSATDMSGLDMEKARKSLFLGTREQMQKIGHFVQSPGAKDALRRYETARPAFTEAQIKAFAKEEIDIHNRVLGRGANLEALSGRPAAEIAKALPGNGSTISRASSTTVAPNPNHVRKSASDPDFRLSQWAIGGDYAKKAMLKYWTEPKVNNFDELLVGLERVTSNPIPAVRGPDIWGSGKPVIYITDSHHRAWQADFLLNANGKFNGIADAAKRQRAIYDNLPEQLKKIMTPEQHASLIDNPKYKLTLNVEKTYNTEAELLTGLVRRQKGLPHEFGETSGFLAASRRAKLLDDGRPVSAADAKVLKRGFMHMAKTFADVKNDPVRSAVGTLFDSFETSYKGRDGTLNAAMRDYSEFLIARDNNLRAGVKALNITPENFDSPAVQEGLKKLFLDTPQGQNALRALAKEGEGFVEWNEAALQQALAARKAEASKPEVEVLQARLQQVNKDRLELAAKKDPSRAQELSRLEAEAKNLETNIAKLREPEIRAAVARFRDDLKNPIRLSDADVADLKAMARSADFTPERFLEKLANSSDPRLARWYGNDAHSGTEMGSIRSHTTDVMRNYETLKGQFGLSQVKLTGQASPDEFMRTFLAVHDIAKSEAVALGAKAAQHEFIGPAVDAILARMGYSPELRALAQSMVHNEALGKMLVANTMAKTPAQSAEILKNAEKNFRDSHAALVKSGVKIGVEDYTKLVSAFYHVDAGAYPFLVGKVFAGGVKRGDQLVELRVADGMYGELMQKLGARASATQVGDVPSVLAAKSRVDIEKVVADLKNHKGGSAGGSVGLMQLREAAHAMRDNLHYHVAHRPNEVGSLVQTTNEQISGMKKAVAAALEREEAAKARDGSQLQKALKGPVDIGVTSTYRKELQVALQDLEAVAKGAEARATKSTLFGKSIDQLDDGGKAAYRQESVLEAAENLIRTRRDARGPQMHAEQRAAEERLVKAQADLRESLNGKVSEDVRQSARQALAQGADVRRGSYSLDYPVSPQARKSYVQRLIDFEERKLKEAEAKKVALGKDVEGSVYMPAQARDREYASFDEREIAPIRKRIDAYKQDLADADAALKAGDMKVYEAHAMQPIGEAEQKLRKAFEDLVRFTQDTGPEFSNRTRYEVEAAFDRALADVKNPRVREIFQDQLTGQPGTKLSGTAIYERLNNAGEKALPEVNAFARKASETARQGDRVFSQLDGIARTTPAPTNARASATNVAAVEVRGTRVMPPSALPNAEPAVKASVSYAKSARTELADSRRAFLHGKGSFEDYQAVAAKHPHFEEPISATTLEARRAELLRRELRHLELEVGEARAEVGLNHSAAAKEKLASLERTHAAVALQALGEGQRKPANPASRLSRMMDAIRGMSSDSSLARQQGKFDGKTMADVVSGADARVLRPARDQEIIESAAYAAETRKASLGWIERNLAANNPARATKLADDVTDLHAATPEKIKPADFLAKKGWKPAEIDNCLKAGGLCNPVLPVRSAQEKSESLSALASKVLYELELAAPGAKGADDALGIARPGASIGKGDALQGAKPRIEAELKAIAKEREAAVNAAAKNTTNAAAKERAAQLGKVQQALDNRLKVLNENSAILASAKPAKLEDIQRDNKTVTGLMEYLASKDAAGLKADLSAHGLENSGLENFAMKGMAKGEDRLAAFKKLKELIYKKREDNLFQAKAGNFFSTQLSSKPGFEKVMQGSVAEIEQALRKSDEISAAAGVKDPRLTAAALEKAKINPERQSVLRVLGATEDNSRSVVETIAEGQVAGKAVEKQAIEKIAAAEKASGRVIASVEEPKAKVFAKGQEAEIAALVEKELAAHAVKTGNRALDEPARKSIAEAAKHLEVGGTEDSIRLMTTRMAGLANDADMFESARLAYLEMGEVLKANPSMRTLRPNEWRELAMREGVARMLKKAGFDEDAIVGKPPKEPGLLARTMACMKL